MGSHHAVWFVGPRCDLPDIWLKAQVKNVCHTVKLSRAAQLDLTCSAWVSGDLKITLATVGKVACGARGEEASTSHWCLEDQ